MFTKRIVQILIISILLIALLPVLQASAASVINVNVTESFTRNDTYQPLNAITDGSVVAGTTGGNGTITIANNAGVVLNNVDLIFSVGYTTGWSVRTADNIAIPYTVTNGEVKIQSFPVNGIVHVEYTALPNYVPPVTLTSTYSANGVTDSLTSSTVIHLTATLNTTALPAGTSVSPVITIVSYDNATRGTVGLADWTFNSSSWSPAALTTAAPIARTDILATVHDTVALSDSASSVYLQPLANSTAAYTITSSTVSASGIALSSATATTSNVTSDITKQLINGIWTFTPNVSVTGPLTYTLSSVTEWAVDSGSLGTTIAVANNPNTFSPGVDITSAAAWVGSGTQLLTFAYSGVPVGFMKPTIALKNTPAQFSMINNGAVSKANGVTLIKSIWIINGYKVEVVKTVTPDATTANEYHIKIVATNTGTASTPPNVFIYDMIPAQFFSASAPVSPTNFVTSAGVGAMQQQQITTGTYNGWYAYYWNLGTLTASPAVGSSDTITYDVYGTGAYDATNLYVVGVDPAQSISQQTTPALQTDATVVNSNLESVMAVGAMCLVLIGMIGTFRRRF